MIVLSNGHSFDFCCGSGALAFDGRGWAWDYPFRWAGTLNPSEFTVVAKTVTTEPKDGNLRWYKPWTCVRLLKRGTVNSVGLTNPGIQKWVSRDYPSGQRQGIKLACSVFAANYEEAICLGYYLKDLDIPFVELNLSCPNAHDVKHIRHVISGLHSGCPHPIIAKVTHDQAFDVDLVELLAEHPGVEAIHAINAVPWDKVFHGVKSPLEKSGNQGGVSGDYIHEKARQAVRSLKNIAPKMKIVAGGGIYSLQAVCNFAEDGADAFSIGTLFLRHPWMPNRIIDQYRKMMF